MLPRALIGVVLCSLASTSPANAGISLTLSSPSNLSALTVGQTVEIDVSLSGLPSNDFVFNLNSKVLFSSSLFLPIASPGTLSGLTATVGPGSIFNNLVQGPLQVANFNFLSAQAGGLASGSATGIFAETPNTNSGAIGLNGVYYSFLLKATSAGTGSINFDPTPGANEYTANDTGFAYAPFNPLGGPLAVRIAPAAVPEPSSILLCGMSGLIVAVSARLRSRAGRLGSAARPT